MMKEYFEGCKTLTFVQLEDEKHILHKSMQNNKIDHVFIQYILL